MNAIARAAGVTLAVTAWLPGAPRPQSAPAPSPAGAASAPATRPALPARQQTIGMPLAITGLVLPGSELEPVPADTRSPIALRITEVHPHGTACRYDLTCQAFEAGTFDLSLWLRRKDGSPTSDLPVIPLEIGAVRLPQQVEPNTLVPATLPRLGGYRALIVVAIAVWLVGLIALLWLGRRRRAASADAVRLPTLADRLRPIVLEAMAGRLPDERRAELERMLLSWWRERLGLQHETAARAIAAMREHPQAGALLRQLEAWLHQPPRAGAPAPVDVAALLAPYQELPAPQPPSTPAAGAAGRPAPAARTGS